MTAADKATGKHSHVTITNEKGRLSHEEIEKMVNDAEQFKDEDKKIRERIEVKNNLESYCLSMKKLIFDESLKTKLTEDEKKLIETSTQKVMEELEKNPSKEDLDKMKLEIE